MIGYRRNVLSLLFETINSRISDGMRAHCVFVCVRLWQETDGSWNKIFGSDTIDGQPLVFLGNRAEFTREVALGSTGNGIHAHP